MILILGLFIMSFGVALSVISDLGTTPISCIPNVLSFASSLSLGMITIIFNFLLIIIQLLILRGDFEKREFLQIFVTIIFGYFIDFALYVLSFINPSNLVEQWILCIMGCFIIAFGVLLEVNSNAIILPGEGVSLAVVRKFNIEFGKMKMIFDTTNVVIGAILSILLFGTFKGVGLGTIFAGIVVGYLVRQYAKILKKSSLNKFFSTN